MFYRFLCPQLCQTNGHNHKLKYKFKYVSMFGILWYEFYHITFGLTVIQYPLNDLPWVFVISPKQINNMKRRGFGCMINATEFIGIIPVYKREPKIADCHYWTGSQYKSNLFLESWRVIDENDIFCISFFCALIKVQK